MISKRESKYRQKLFAEKYCNKKEQQKIDKYIEENRTLFNMSYFKLYQIHRNPYSNPVGVNILCGVGMNMIKILCARVGVDIQNEDKSYKSTFDILEDLSRKWDQVGTIV